MKIVPLLAVPSQTFSVLLAGQQCAINLYVEGDSLYFDLSSNQVVICTGVRCMDRVKLVRYDYLGFTGDFAFMDFQGTNDPTYDGLGSRYQLVYLETSDL